MGHADGRAAALGSQTAADGRPAVLIHTLVALGAEDEELAARAQSGRTRPNQVRLVLKSKASAVQEKIRNSRASRDSAVARWTKVQ